MEKELHFKDIKVLVKIRDVHKIEKKNFIAISVFGYQNKEKYSVYVSKECCEAEHVDLLLIGEEDKRYYVLTKDFKTIMYSDTLYGERKHFVVIASKLLLQKKY